ncbi:MAG: histidine ammonia-lyase [Rhodospirillaceae bacterium]|nr:histidine ammonia-lyase [Rhodospirillaceae bacterium]
MTIRPGHLTLADCAALAAGGFTLRLDPKAWPAVEASAATVAKLVKAGKPVYGINTGFGSLARARIADSDLAELQRRLVLSHMAGTGAALNDRVVRLVLALKAASLAQGFSGVRRQIVEMLIALHNKNVLPIVPAQGSVGASGDLAPLAHMSALLIGHGKAKLGGRIVAAKKALAAAGLEPIVLGAKEGLALLNGTQVSTALALTALIDAQMLLASAIVTGTMSVDAAAGSDVPFDPRIHAVRGQAGQVAVATIYRRLLKGSQIRDSHLDCDRVQDPYSLRCQPQVMGACHTLLQQAASVLIAEANGVSDNPLVFTKEGQILSGGNFHAEPVALAADTIALAIAEIGSLAERRIALLTDSRMSELPAFLVPEPGLNSGFMIAQVTAAALASENKQRAAPASIDSLPTSANQEDHVSMATHAARRLHEMNTNLAGIVAIEYLAAAQGIDLRAPLKTSPALAKAMKALRAKVKMWRKDREMAVDIEAARAIVEAGTLAVVAQG